MTSLWLAHRGGQRFDPSRIHKSYMKIRNIQSAGGVVIRNSPSKQILLIKFYDGSGLSFPKGHIEKDESIEEAAIREVKEETGIKNIKVLNKLGIVTRPGVEMDGAKVIKDIHLYLMNTKDELHSKSDEDWGWFDIDEAIDNMSFPQEKEFLNKIRSKLWM